MSCPAHGFPSLLPEHRADSLTSSAYATHFLPLEGSLVARLLPGAQDLFRDLRGAAFCFLGPRFIGRLCTWLFSQSLCLLSVWGSPVPLWALFGQHATLFKSLLIENHHHLSFPSTLLSCLCPFPTTKCQETCCSVCYLRFPHLPLFPHLIAI